MTVPRLSADPLTDRCADLLAEGRHVCLGISPFNGYYTQDRITRLAAWAVDTFDEVSFYVPDTSPAHTFVALGYSPEKARAKARKQAKCVLNRIRTAMASVGMPADEGRILWSQPLAENARYVELADRVRAVFDGDDDFRNALTEATSWILAGAMAPGVVPTHEQRRIAVEYLLDEFPLFLDGGGIAGASGSLFVYHQRVGLLDRLFAGDLVLRPEPRQGYLVVADAVSDRSDEAASERVLVTA